MFRVVKSFLLLSLLAVTATGSMPKVGDRAPAFSLKTSTDSTVALKDYAGKSKVVVLFYRGHW